MKKLLFLIILTLSGCATAPIPVVEVQRHQEVKKTSPAPVSDVPQVIEDGKGLAPKSLCQSSHGLPDRMCTPGAINPKITQKEIYTTICNSGWSTKSIRPPVSYTGKLKRKQMAQYGYTDSPENYEEDHLISLELGGSPTDPKNLWPEAYQYPDGSPGAKEKDKVENALHALICSGKISLKDAQQEIATDWTAVYSEIGHD